jgi:hypothetical protein
MWWVVKLIPYSLSHPYFIYIYVFYFYAFIFRKQKSNIFLIKLYLTSKNLIVILLQSLRFDTLNIALSYKDLYYYEW